METKYAALSNNHGTGARAPTPQSKKSICIELKRFGPMP